MDLRTILGDPSNGADTSASLRCSAKACRSDAQWAIRWNNPRLHTPERRKVWLACDEHEQSLREFLSRRGFYLDSVRPSDLASSDG